MDTPDEGEGQLDKAAELRKLEFHIDTAGKSISGEHIFGDVVYEDLSKSIKRVEVAGLETPLLAKGRELLQKIPESEISNIHNKTEQFLSAGDIASAKQWHGALNRSIGHYAQIDGALSREKINAYQKQANELYAKVYS